MPTYTLAEVHRRAAELVNEARYGSEPVIITDHGKPAAAIIAPAMLEHYQWLENEHDLAEIEKIKARGPHWLSDAEAQRLMDEIDAEAEAQGL